MRERLERAAWGSLDIGRKGRGMARAWSPSGPQLRGLGSPLEAGHGAASRPSAGPAYHYVQLSAACGDPLQRYARVVIRVRRASDRLPASQTRRGAQRVAATIV